MARQFFPAQASILSDTRVRVHYADGRRFVKTAKSKIRRNHCRCPRPPDGAVEPFYTSEFFRSAREHLAPGGLLAIELRSAEETLSPDLKDFLRCIRHTLEEIFPHVVAIPGETIHFFGAASPVFSLPIHACSLNACRTGA